MQDLTQNYKVLHLGDMAFVGYKLVDLLRKNGFPADYLAYSNSEIKTWNNPWEFSFKTIPSERFNKIKVMRESLSFCSHYDIVHAHSIFAMPLLFSKKPFILHLHGSDVRVYAKEFTPLGLGLKMLIRKANKIFVSTPDLLGEVSAFGKNATFLPNPVDFNVFKPFESNIDLHEGTEFVIFHPASHSPTKRNDILIKGFSNVVKQGYDVKLVMVEWGSLLEESKKLVEKLNLTKNVKWIHNIPFTRMADYYNASDIVCDQYVIGGLGLVSLEAMACGKPVITKYNSINNKQGYSIEPPIPTISNEKNITDEIIKLLEKPSLRGKLGKECREWVRKEHSTERIISNLCGCYRALATG